MSAGAGLDHRCAQPLLTQSSLILPRQGLGWITNVCADTVITGIYIAMFYAVITDTVISEI